MIKKLYARLMDPFGRSQISVDPIYPISSARMTALMQEIAQTTGTTIVDMKSHY